MKTLRSVSLLLLLLIVMGFIHQQDHYYYEREKMVQTQIIARGIVDKAVIEAMRKVQRHLFVPENSKKYAYQDGPLVIGYGQTISQPYIVAYMTEVIRPSSCLKVLEIGTGSGYQAAILAEIVPEVYTVEIIPELAASSKNRLQNLKYRNIYCKTADGYYGWKEKAPFDAIVVTAAVEFIPPPLIAQLKEGGRMIIPVGSAFQVQMLMLIQKKNGKTVTKSLMPVRFVPFTRSK